MKKGSALDPKGLIYEAYRIDGIDAAQCRTIFLDWALSLPVDRDQRADLKDLLDQYAETAPDHPMTTVMRDGLATQVAPKRRGGWRSRPRD